MCLRQGWKTVCVAIVLGALLLFSAPIYAQTHESPTAGASPTTSSSLWSLDSLLTWFGDWFLASDDWESPEKPGPSDPDTNSEGEGDDGERGGYVDPLG